MTDAKAKPLPQPADPEATLAWEAANRKRATACAWGAGLLTLLGAVVTGLGISGLPNYDADVVTIPDAMRDLAAGQPIPPGRLALQAEWLGQHATVPIIGAVIYGIGSLLIFGAFVYLFKATRARNPRFTQLALVAGAAGIVMFAVGRTTAEISRYIGASGFAGGGNQAASDALTGGSFFVAQIIWQLGAFAAGFGFVLLGLNAMRAGLLTRFMGVLAMIVGVTFILPIDQQGVIRAFWLIALGFLLALKWPGGAPKAWLTGEAEPWPSAAEQRAQRAAAAEAAAGDGSGGSSGGGSSGKRKRKR
ncbi:MAG: hypothetical protein FGM34_00920 [Solirubrobacteraceae bacterium]|nr:hypothetical protein [Solirubrobacteraceae bacterium]